MKSKDCREPETGIRFFTDAMDRPVQILLLLGAGLFSAITAGAQPATPVTTPVEIEVAPSRERAISPHIAALLAASRPKLEAPVAAEKKTAQPAVADEPQKRANGIVRLPRYAGHPAFSWV